MLIFKELRLTLLALLLVGTVCGSACAQSSVTVFVGKSSVSAVVHAGRVFAPAEALLRAMGFSWSAQGDGYVLTSGTGGGPAIREKLFSLHFEDRTAVPATWVRNGKVWIDARMATEGLGGLYLFSPSTGVAQVSFTRKDLSKKAIGKAVRRAEENARRQAGQPPRAWSGVVTAPSTNIGKEGGGGEKTESVEPGKPGEDDPISVQRTEFSTNNVGILRGTVVLKNDADKTVRNIMVYVTMMSSGPAAPPAPGTAGGQQGTASLPSYAKATTDNTLPFYSGTPPSTVSSSYPGAAGGGVNTGNPYAAPTPPPAPPTPTPRPEVSASPQPTPALTPVATLPVIYVAEIAPGGTASVSFTWTNDKGVTAQPSVQTSHDKVEFSRKKEATEESGDKDKSGAGVDKDKSDEKSSDTGASEKGDKNKSADKKKSGEETKPGDKSKPDKSGKSTGEKPSTSGAPDKK